MPQITAWKCSYTKKLFETKKEYLKHLRVIAKDNLAEKTHNKHIQAAIDMVQLANNIEELEIAASKAMVNYYKARGLSISTDNITIKLSDMYFNWSCSNSNSCPKNGVMNWCNTNPNAPKGYPGLSGRINISLTETAYNNVAKARNKCDNTILDFSDLLAKVSIHTGTGGYSGGKLSYDVKIFSDDFSKLAEVNNPVIEDILT